MAVDMLPLDSQEGYFSLYVTIYNSDNDGEIRKYNFSKDFKYGLMKLAGYSFLSQ